MATDPDTDAVIAGELRLMDRIVRRSADPGTGAAALLDPSFVEFGSSGRAWERDTMLAALQADDTPAPDVRDLTTTRLAPDVVLLTYRTFRERRSTLRSSVWRRDGDGVWRVVFHQGTPQPPVVTTRIARAEDASALGEIDHLTWTTLTSPAPKPDLPRPFFQDGRRDPADVLVAELDRTVVGCAALGDPSGMPAHAHVREIVGVAVHPAATGCGAGRAVVEAAVAEAGRRGARKVTLRVLGHNGRARRLYARCGFVEEGVQRAEFLLDGRWVDDVLMARHLGSP